MKRIPVAFEEGLAVACLVTLVVVTLLNVVTRYVTEQSSAWTEELSVVLMVVMALAGASAATARDRHVRIEVLYDGGSARWRRRLRVVSALAVAVLFALLAVLFARLVVDDVRWGETTMGLGIPRWWTTVWLPLLCAAIALRAAGLARRWIVSPDTAAGPAP